MAPEQTRITTGSTMTDRVSAGRTTRRTFLAAVTSFLAPSTATVLAPAMATLLAPTPASARGHHRSRLAAPAVLRRPSPPTPLVMLDPGHGGKDPGAIGYAGTYEKHIAIAAAAELCARLLASGTCRPVLTRDDDRFIPLEDRVAIAERHGAALFVSMHADSIASHAIRGASVYTLATAASDAQTASLAQRENSADRFAGPRFRGTAPAVQRILADLVADETRAGSARMAGDVVRSFRRGAAGGPRGDARGGDPHGDVALLPNPSRHAAFVVLKSPSIPSVLVEMGFMSNPMDEALLRTRAHRDRITLAMQGAIGAFLDRDEAMTRLSG